MKSEIKKIWYIAWPLIITNLLNVTVGIIDFKMVGVLGVDPIAAVGISRQVMMLLMVLMIAIAGGCSILIAQAYGAKDFIKLRKIAGNTVAITVLAAVLIITPIGVFGSGIILKILGADEAVIALGRRYLVVLFSGSIFTMFGFSVTGILLGISRTKISLYILIGVNLLNIVLNYIFIFGHGLIPPFGVTGAAMGTIFSRALGSLAGLFVLISHRFPIQISLKKLFIIDWSIIKKILFIGGPRAMQGVVRNVSRLATIFIIGLMTYSTNVVSAYSVGMQVKMISSFIGPAFMSAASARVGQNIGAGNMALAKKSGWLSSAMAFSIMLIPALLFYLFPETIMAFFTIDKQVIEMGRLFFVIIAASEPIMAFAFAIGGALRGGGESIAPFIYSSLSDIVIVIGGGILLALVFDMGIAGLAIVLALSALTRAVPTVLKYHWGKLKRVL